MICASWLYYDMKYLIKCPQLLWILLLIIYTFDTAMATQIQSQHISQDFRNKPLSGRLDNSNVCYDNMKSLLSYSANEFEILSSKDEPSNQKSPSSRNTFLPQGSVEKFAYNFRFDSSTLMPYLPMAGCISLNNYYWKYNVSSTFEEDSVFGVQIYVFHILNNTDKYANINLRILLHSTQGARLDRPVTIVLSSFLPRTFYLSVLSYLSGTHQPIHIIMTNFNSDVILIDQNLNNSDLERITISVLDSSYNRIFQFTNPSDDDKNMLEIRERILRTDLFQFGNFSGYQYNSILSSKLPETLWLFGNGMRYSKRIPNIKLVAIYVVFNKSNGIDLKIGKPEDQRNSVNNEFYREQCTIVTYDNYKSLEDRISTFAMSILPLYESRTCAYYIKPSLVPVPSNMQYQSVTWLHLKKTANVTVYLKLTSNRFYKKNETHLVILTGDRIKWSTIHIESFFLYKKVHVLSNISMDQFDERSSRSSFLITMNLVNSRSNSGSDSTLSQDQIIANYIAASSSTVLHTTVYELKLRKEKDLFEIRINVDDSQARFPARVTVNPGCGCNSHNDISPSLWIDLNKWKLHNNLIPSKFIFGNQNREFKQINDTHFRLDIQRNDCFSLSFLKAPKVYGIVLGKKYILNMSFKHHCPKHNKKIKSTTEILPQSTPSTSVPNFIIKSEHGFNVFNDSRFKNLLDSRQLQDKDRLFIEIMQNIAWEISLNEGIHVRDCYLTNQKATEYDLKYSNHSASIGNLKKVNIVKGGCINDTDLTYSDIDRNMRPQNHAVKNNLLYRFSVGVDGNRWASDLSLSNQWLCDGRIEVHLYCGVNPCYVDKTEISQPMSDIGECWQENECEHQLIPLNQTYMYFGSLLIVKSSSHINVKISILAILSLVTVILLLLFLMFLRRLHSIHCQLKHNRTGTTGLIVYRQTSIEMPAKVRKRSLDKAGYCIVKLSDGTHHLLIGDHHENHDQDTISSSNSSLHQVMLDASDKSILLRASYITSKTVQLSQSNDTAAAMPLADCMIPEPYNHKDRPLYSWPLSSADHNRPSNNSQSSSQPPPLQTSLLSRLSFNSSTIRDRWFPLGGSVAVTSNSNPCSSSTQKLTSNRTTVSGESAATISSEMPGNKSQKWWWSPLSNNCSLRKSIVMSRD